MYKYILAVLLLPAFAWGQSHEPFTGTAARLDSPQVQKWVRMGGQFGGGATIKRNGSNVGVAGYYNDSTGFYGAAYFDTAVGTGTEARLIISSFGGSLNTKEIMIFRDDNTTFASGGGAVLQVQQMSGTNNDYMYLRAYGTNRGTGGSTLGYPSAAGTPTGASAMLFSSRDWVVGDTIFLRFWPGGIWTGGVAKLGGGVDSLSFSTSVVTGADLTNLTNAATTAGRWGIQAAVRSTSSTFDDFVIQAVGTAAPPPPGEEDTTPPVITTASPSAPAVFADSTVYGILSATDDFGLRFARMDTSANSGTTWKPLDSVNINTGSPVLSYSWNSKTYSRTGPDTVWNRFVVSDDSLNWDTSATFTTIWSALPTGGAAATIKVGGQFPLWEMHMGSGTNGNFGSMPASVVQWQAYSYAIVFAVNWSSPTSFSGSNWVTSRRAPLNALAHAAGTPILLSIGNTPDPFRNNAIGAANRTASINFMMQTLDLYGYDGFDINMEYPLVADSANYSAWIAQLYDSLQTRNNSYTWTGKPILTCDIALSNTGGQYNVRSMWVRLEPYFDVMHIMAYDKTASWNSWVYFDNGIRSRTASGVLTEINQGNGGNNYMMTWERNLDILTAVGGNPAKYSMGLDLNAAGQRGGVMTNGSGASWPREVYSTSPTYFSTGQGVAADWKFDEFYRDRLSLYPDSVHFDDTAKAYFISRDLTGTANDEFISFMGGPGLDSAIVNAVRFVQEKDLAGFMPWTVSESYLGTDLFPAATYPTLERDWLTNQVLRYTSVETVAVKLPPPTLVYPANGETDLATTVIARWNQVAGMSKYWVILDDSVTFIGTMLSQDSSKVTVTDTTKQWSGGLLVNGRTYYWKVATKNANGWGGFSAIRSFTVTPGVASTPVITYPLDGQTLPGTSTVVTWGAATNGPTTYSAVTPKNFYQLQVGSGTTFGTIFKGDSGQTVTLSRIYNLFGMVNSGVYSIRVRAVTPAGYGAWSDTVQITTGAAAPDVPILSSPPDNIGNLSVLAKVLAWNVASNALTYDVEFDSSDLFLSPISSANTAGLTHTTPALDSGQTYFWHVRSIGGSDTSNWSQTFSFTTTQAAPPPPVRRTVQMGVYYNVNTGTFDSRQPAPWLIYGWTLPDMSDVPTPDSGVFAWSVFGIKTRDTTILYQFGPASGASPLTMEEIIDSLEAREGLYLRRPVIEDYVTMVTDSGSPIYSRVFPGHTSTPIFATLPNLSGQMGVFNSPAQDILLRHATLLEALGNESGGTGLNAADSLTGFFRFNPDGTTSLANPDSLEEGVSYSPTNASQTFKSGVAGASMRTINIAYTINDSTSTNILTFPAIPNKVIYYNAYFTATSADGTTGGAYFSEGGVKFSAAGAASLLSTAIDNVAIGESSAAYNGWSAISAGTLYFGVKGAPATPLQWSVVVQYVVAE